MTSEFGEEGSVSVLKVLKTEWGSVEYPIPTHRHADLCLTGFANGSQHTRKTQPPPDIPPAPPAFATLLQLLHLFCGFGGKLKKGKILIMVFETDKEK